MTPVIDPAGVARAQSRSLPSSDAVRVAALLHLLADPVRLRLTCALDAAEEVCVGDLALTLQVSPDSVTYALRLMRSAGMVSTRRRGTVVYNSLADDFARLWRGSGLRDLIAAPEPAANRWQPHRPTGPLNTTPATTPNATLPTAHR